MGRASVGDRVWVDGSYSGTVVCVKGDKCLVEYQDSNFDIEWVVAERITGGSGAPDTEEQPDQASSCNEALDWPGCKRAFRDFQQVANMHAELGSPSLAGCLLAPLSLIRGSRTARLDRRARFQEKERTVIRRHATFVANVLGCDGPLRTAYPLLRRIDLSRLQSPEELKRALASQRTKVAAEWREQREHSGFGLACVRRKEVRISSCTCCGSDQVFLEQDVVCAQTESYHVNEPGSPGRTDIIARAHWHIALCRVCAEKRLDEELRRARHRGLYVGPVLIVCGVVLAGFIAAIVRAFEAGGVFAALAIIGCGLVVLRGIIMIPVGLYNSAKANARLNALRINPNGCSFSEEERWDMIGAEGLRVIECLEKNRRDFHGSFALPRGTAKDPGMGESTLSWGLLPKGRSKT